MYSSECTRKANYKKKNKFCWKGYIRNLRVSDAIKDLGASCNKCPLLKQRKSGGGEGKVPRCILLIITLNVALHALNVNPLSPSVPLR